MGDAGAAEGRRQGPLDWRLQLQRGATGAVPRDRAHHVAPTALFGGLAGGGGGAIALLPGARNRRDRLFADEIRVADRYHDARTGGGPAGRRFPPPRARLPGTATHAQPDRKSTRLNSSHANISY